MSLPIQNFRVSAAYNSVGQFYVHVWPTRYGGSAAGVDEGTHEEEQRMFIENAIREKLERERDKP